MCSNTARQRLVNSGHLFLQKHCSLSKLFKATFILTTLTPLLKCNHIQQRPLLSAPAKSRSLLWQPSVPEFYEPIGNHTAAVGRDAQLACKIKNLGNYRTAWLRVEDKGILTIHNNVITRNYRVSLKNSDDGNTFLLSIKNVQPSDKGGYMCQINSVPMKYAIGYLDVLTPPVFSDDQDDVSDNNEAATNATVSLADSQQQDAVIGPSSMMAASKTASQVTVTEGSNATLTCKARGHPAPVINWRREDGQAIQLSTPSDDVDGVKQVEGSSITFPLVSRLHAGAYLCIASNGVQPSASKRQVLDVQYSPVVRLPQTELSASLGQQEVQLDCFAELNPLGDYHWVKLASSTTTSTQPVATSANQQEADDRWLIEHDGLMQSDKYDIVIKQVASDKVHMVLNIRRIERQDFGWYKCIAQNKMGLQSSAIRLSESPSSTTATSSFRAIGHHQTDSASGGHAQDNETRNQENVPHQSNMRQRAQTRSSWIQRTTGARSQQVATASASSFSPSIQTNFLVTLVAAFVSLLAL